MRGHVLITGGTGFIGRSLMAAIRSAGYLVTSVSRTVIETDNSCRLDLTNSLQVSEFIKNSEPIDTIVHCAAIAHGEKAPKGYTISEFNSLMVVNLLSAFTQKQPHWIFLSSISVYGGNFFNSYIPFDISPKTTDSYGTGKLRDENSLLNACQHLDILRLMPTYDAAHMDDLKKRICIPKTDVKIRICPSPSYNFCHVKVVGVTVLNCLKNAEGKRLHQVGDPNAVFQRDLLEKFSGVSIVIPQVFFKFVLILVPRKLKWFSNIRLMLGKLGLPNTYELGIKSLDQK
jgi:nucleoside-diphosphate-sugar epimerase